MDQDVRQPVILRRAHGVLAIQGDTHTKPGRDVNVHACMELLTTSKTMIFLQDNQVRCVCHDSQREDREECQMMKNQSGAKHLPR